MLRAEATWSEKLGPRHRCQEIVRGPWKAIVLPGCWGSKMMLILALKALNPKPLGFRVSLGFMISSPGVVGRAVLELHLGLDIRLHPQEPL